MKCGADAETWINSFTFPAQFSGNKSSPLHYCETFWQYQKIDKCLNERGNSFGFLPQKELFQGEDTTVITYVLK